MCVCLTQTKVPTHAPTRPGSPSSQLLGRDSGIQLRSLQVIRAQFVLCFANKTPFRNNGIVIIARHLSSFDKPTMADGRQAVRMKCHTMRRPMFLTFNHKVYVCGPEELDALIFFIRVSLVT